MGSRVRVIRSLYRSLSPVQRRLLRGSVACCICGALAPWVPTGGLVLIGLIVVLVLVQVMIILGMVRKEADSMLPGDDVHESDC